MKSSLFLASILLTPAFVIAAEGGPSLPPETNSLVTGHSSLVTGGGATAAASWVSFAAEHDIEPGSALDFSWIANAHAPCGVHGRIVVRNGHFEFEGRPGEPVRFWGVNISSGANFPDVDKAEQIAAHLAALGYNAVRIHHHDGGLVAQNPNTTALDPDALRRHDVLVAACSRHGLYIATDLYVSRPVAWRAVGIDRDGTMGKGEFKHLVPVHDGAFSNFCAFAAAWLGHTNAFTGVRFADDPALLSVALINEGNLDNGAAPEPFVSLPNWQEKWAAWLEAHRAPGHAATTSAATPRNDDALRAKDKGDIAANDGASRHIANDVHLSLPLEERPVIAAAGGPSSPPAGRLVIDAGEVTDFAGIPPGNHWQRTRHIAAFSRFLADVEADFEARAVRFLREEIGLKAPISNMSSWMQPPEYQGVLAGPTQDYVEAHAYCDHPTFPGKAWGLPCRVGTENPVRKRVNSMGHGAMGATLKRIFGKPFCVTEFNYCAPNPHRGAGGLLFGAEAAAQGWSGAWRFDWAATKQAIETPETVYAGLFAISGDPLRQASERIAAALFLRGDLAPCADAYAVLLPPSKITGTFDGESTQLNTPWPELTWRARLGTVWAEEAPSWARWVDSYPDYYTRTGAVAVLPPRDDIAVDREAGWITVATPRTSAVFAEGGTHTAGVMRVEIGIVDPGSVNNETSDCPQITNDSATVWASVLDDADSLGESSHILVGFLTDLRNTGQAEEPEPTTTLVRKWGTTPHLVRADRVRVELATAPATDGWRCYALSQGGRRLAEAPVSRTADGRLAIDLDNASGGAATMFWELCAAKPAEPVFGGALSLPGITLHPRAFDPNWRGWGSVTAAAPDDPATVRFQIKVDAKSAKTVFAGTASYSVAPNGAVHVDWRIIPDRDADLAETYVGGDVPFALFGGGRAVVDGSEMELPARRAEKPHLFRSAVSSLALYDRNGAARLHATFDEPTEVLLQDGRHWGGNELTLRFLFAKGPVNAGQEYAVSATFATPSDGPLTLKPARTFRLNAGPDWVPLRYDPWIEPGSALDFTEVLPHHSPAGKFGRVVAVGDHFELEDRPGVPQRFYGVNLCSTANLPESAEEADRFAANLARIGYNAVRIHHHEKWLVTKDGKLPEGAAPSQPVGTGPSSTPFDDAALDPVQIEKFDLLIASCIKHGLYITTDLYVSRGHVIPWRTLGIDRDGVVKLDSFKILVAFHEPAYSNLCAWSKNFLTHVNPHTGHSLAEEPALATLALVNEGNLGNWGPQLLRDTPGVASAWQAWLAKRRNDNALRANDGALRANDEGASRQMTNSLPRAAQSVIAATGGPVIAPQAPAFDWSEIPDTIPGSLSAKDGSTPEGRHAAAFAIFLAEREAMLFERLKAFVRDECGCKAPLSSLSSWYNPVQYQLARTHFDYVDDHFYVDHPQFLDTPWRLPSRCPNTNPLAGPGRGARSVQFRRLMDKPFCITEFNYAAPGRFRGVGGIATGALAALQDWSGLWRFAWSHSHNGIARPGGQIGYFDVASDPLALAAERAALCLFLRGDISPFKEARPIVLYEATLLDPRHGAPKSDFPDRLAEGWTARVGTKVVSTQSGKDEQPVIAGAAGPVTVDGESGAFTIDTPRTAGGFAESGSLSAGPLTFTLAGCDGPVPQGCATNHSSLVARRPSFRGGNAVAATVWVSSLDGEPIASSRHLLLTHLSDVQNSGMEYADPGRTTLLKWGGLPHIMRRGAALIELSLKERPVIDGDGGGPATTVFRLSSSGRRLGEVPATWDPATGHLLFTARTDWDPGAATYLYEIVRE